MVVENGLGVQVVLRSGVSGKYPMSYAETPGGLLLLANGIDPMHRWDGLSALADTAGVIPPRSAMTLGGTGVGYITGELVAYQRFVDRHGNYSDLSPVSNLMEAGLDGFIEDINYSTTTGRVTIKSTAHGLTTGWAILIDSVAGIPLVNGQWVVTVVDADTFTLNGLTITGGIYTEGGVWTLGIATVVYGSVPASAESKVVRRQILRNLSGNADTLYVDLDTTDLASTSFSSTRTDESLATCEAVPMFWGEATDLPYANRNAAPPSHKAVIVAHKGRIFASADIAFADGHIEPVFNSATVAVVGGAWPQSFVGRTVYIAGAQSSYRVAAVDPSGASATLDRPYLDPPTPYALYTVKPQPGERRLVYYSEPGLPESWPAWNAVAVPECNDDIVGLATLGLYLYVIERRHIWQYTYEESVTDGQMFLAAHRGSLSNRTYCITDTGLFFLDEIGIHKFDGQESKPISEPIQNIFQTGDGTSDVQVDWSADQTLWHAAHDPARDTIRWVVTMVGFAAPYHAICYNYRNDRWWVERYPTPLVSSANATIGYRRSLAGTDARRIICLSEGAYDGISGDGTTRGNPTSAGSVSLTDATASFDAIEGVPIQIVDGTGTGQQRIIASNTQTVIQVVQPWATVPDTTSVYQIGGIPWEWRSGWFKFTDDEMENPRDVEVIFRPLGTATLLTITLFYDHSDTPKTWGRTIEQDGIRTIEGTPEIVVDMTTNIGFVQHRGSGHGDPNASPDRFISIGLSGVQSGDTVRVSQIVLKGVEKT